MQQLQSTSFVLGDLDMFCQIRKEFVGGNGDKAKQQRPQGGSIQHLVSGVFSDLVSGLKVFSTKFKCLLFL
jgi:hypothetical protein